MKKITFAFIFCAIISCNSNEEINGVINIDDIAEVSFYDIFSSVEIIPLETTNQSLLSMQPVNKSIFENNKFYIKNDKKMEILVFEENGKFIKSIDHLGRGVGEYTYIQDFNINRFTGNLEILTLSNILAYNIDTDLFIEEYPIPVPPKHAVNHFMNLTNEIDVFYSIFENKKITIFSRKENRILNEYYELPEFIYRKTFLNPIGTPFYLYNDTVKFFQDYNGEIFSINNQDYNASTTHRWNFGERELKLSDIPDDLLGRKEYKDYISKLRLKHALHFMFNGETSEYIISKFYYKESTLTIFKSKDTKTNYIFDKFKEGFGITLHLITEDAIYASVPYSKIPDYVNVDLLTEENRAKLSNLTEDDNDVIIKYVFKK